MRAEVEWNDSCLFALLCTAAANGVWLAAISRFRVGKGKRSMLEISGKQRNGRIEQGAEGRC